MLILGIESSCDETAAALVEDGRKIRSSYLASSAEIHKKYGGVVPEIASRMHVESILPVLATAMEQAGCNWEELDGIAVTHGPGLQGALLVGLTAAKALSFALNKPLYAVHHIAAHMAANYLADPTLEPPFLCMVVSGGHSQLIQVRDYTDFEILATTRDDAAGEAFDKVGREIGLPYPAGPAIDRLSQQGCASKFRFPRTRFPNGSLDFSFSGVKTAALTFVQKTRQMAQRENLDWEKEFPFADFVASYQAAIIEPLVAHAEEAMKAKKLQHLVLAGGVSANQALRKLCLEMVQRNNWSLHCPEVQYCTDNAAMVASMGAFVARVRPQGWNLTLDVCPHLNLKEYKEELHA